VGHLRLIRHAALRRQPVDNAWENPRQSVQKIVQPAPVICDRLLTASGPSAWCSWSAVIGLGLARSDPGIDFVAVAALLEPLQQPATSIQ
jgi:hypothetical protein